MQTQKWTNFHELIRKGGKPKDSNHQYLHGFVYGIDYPCPDSEGKPYAMSAEVDQTTYHALVLDDRLFDENALKDQFTGKNNSRVVERLATIDPEIAKEFFLKYNNV